MLSLVDVFRNRWHLASGHLDARLLPLVLIAFIVMVSRGSANAADNELTPAEKAEGWVLLFDGQGTTRWRNNTDKPVTAKVEDGAINPHGCGGYIMVYDKEFGDFELKCDVKMDQPYCNSGIFVRTGTLSDPVQTGIEIQVFADTKPSLQSFGAIYDLVAASKDATHGPNNWDTMVVRCDGPQTTVTVNGEKVATMNCDEWTAPKKRPDGTAHKFDKALKDFPRKGYIGLQDHGYNVWYKNIKLKELPAKK
jgi:hypothetical protein